ncbi:MAG: ribosomal protein S18-alanine N-acetyltransferase [Bowdeniella nasicola]|nr:ribosomal protein S18-alanine N-acetyltransferase [Bowdeniella nasicola]
MNETPHLRSLTPSDAPRLAELDRALFGLDAWSCASYAAELARADRIWLGHEAGGVLLSYAGVSLAPQGDLLTIGVASDAQGRGLGRELLEEITSAAFAQRVRDIFLEVRVDNVRARHLYRDSGFSQITIRKRYYRGGIDAVVMRRTAPWAAIGPVGSEVIS